jgi:hypothetical protein
MQPPATDVHMALLDLSQLEQRFRLRAHEGQIQEGQSFEGDNGSFTASANTFIFPTFNDVLQTQDTASHSATSLPANAFSLPQADASAVPPTFPMANGSPQSVGVKPISQSSPTPLPESGNTSLLHTVLMALASNGGSSNVESLQAVPSVTSLLAKGAEGIPLAPLAPVPTYPSFNSAPAGPQQDQNTILLQSLLNSALSNGGMNTVNAFVNTLQAAASGTPHTVQIPPATLASVSSFHQAKIPENGGSASEQMRFQSMQMNPTTSHNAIFPSSQFFPAQLANQPPSVVMP